MNKNFRFLIPLLMLTCSQAGNCFSDDGMIFPSGAKEESAVRPNVVVFLSDDQGYGDFSFTGNPDLATPNIDGLARDGAFLDNFYVCPVCSPTRAEFLTGRYHPRGGVYSTSAGGERLDLDEMTIAQAFKSAGYATAAFGKWHNGMQAPYHPNSRGFDEFYGFCSGHWGHYFDAMLEHNGDVVRGKGFMVDDLTNHAMKFIEDHKDNPFFVYLPYNTPHSPMQVPDKYWDKFKDNDLSQLPPEFKKFAQQKGKGIDHARAALAMCENIDHNVGRVLAKLDELQLADNTIVVYFCDNGPNGARYNVGLKGRKGSTDEGGVRSPLFVRWPEKIQPGTKVELVSGAIDLFPTLTKLCGIDEDYETKKPFDGVSFHLELQGAKVKRQPRLLFSHWNKKISVRSQQYRLDHKGVLYDLINDRGQTKPINDQPEIQKRLADAAEEFKTEILAELERPDASRPKRSFPVGHRSMTKTQLPARDATFTGDLERSNRYPNCSYIKNWISKDDKIVWPIDVVESGKFKVELYYCLGKDNVGPEVELSCLYSDKAKAVSRVVKTIRTAHESELIGAEHDRSVRGESLVKNFKAIEIGLIELEQDHAATFELKTTEMPGNESIEFRLLMLTRVE